MVTGFGNNAPTYSSNFKWKIIIGIPGSVSGWVHTENFFITAEMPTTKCEPLNRFLFSLSIGSIKSITWSKHLLTFDYLNSSFNLYIWKKYFPKKFFRDEKVINLFFYYSVGCPKSTNTKEVSLTLHCNHSVALIQTEYHREV